MCNNTSKSNGTNRDAGSGSSSTSDKHSDTTNSMQYSEVSCGGSCTYRKIAECALGLSLPLWSTIAVQADSSSCRVSRLVVSTMVFYGGQYALLRHFGGLLQPPLEVWQWNKEQTPSTATRAASEWRSRLLAIFNALVLSYGSLLCFLEWPSYYPESEGWMKTEDSSSNCFSSHPVTFASLFVGYLQWDLCWLIWHRRSHPDLGSMIHHSIFIAVTHFVLWGTYFRKPFAWLSLTEVSTPFLHLRWFLAATGRKGARSGGGKDSSLYFLASVGFALSFLSTRAVGYGLGLLDLWRSFEFWKEVGGLWWVVGGLHLAYGLNLFWSYKVCSAFLRILSHGTKIQKKKN